MREIDAVWNVFETSYVWYMYVHGELRVFGRDLADECKDSKRLTGPARGRHKLAGGETGGGSQKRRGATLAIRDPFRVLLPLRPADQRRRPPRHRDRVLALSRQQAHPPRSFPTASATSHRASRQLSVSCLVFSRTRTLNTAQTLPPMRTKHTPHSLLTFPVYSSAFVMPTEFVIGGGGGQSKTGIKHKPVRWRASFLVLQPTNEACLIALVPC